MLLVALASVGLREYPITTVGTAQRADEALFTDEREHCAECGLSIDRGQYRRYAAQYVAFGYPCTRPTGGRTRTVRGAPRGSSHPQQTLQTPGMRSTQQRNPLGNWQPRNCSEPEARLATVSRSRPDVPAIPRPGVWRGSRGATGRRRDSLSSRTCPADAVREAGRRDRRRVSPAVGRFLT
jgi:hypothetical protein